MRASCGAVVALASLIAGCSFSGAGTALGDDVDAAAPPGDDAPDAASLGPWAAPAPVGLVPSDASDDDPSLTGDELELYFNSSRGGNADIWVATRAQASDPWGTPALVAELSTADVETTPEVSSDGLTLYLSSSRPGGAGSNDIWVSTRPGRTDRWSTPVLVGDVNSAGSEASSVVTPDGLVIVFTSDIDGGDADVFISSRASTDDPFSAAWIEETAINWPGHDGSTYLLPDKRTLYFDTDRDGHLQLYESHRANAEAMFPAPVPVAGLVGPDNDQDPWVSPDGHHLVFNSDRGGMPGLWEAWR